MPRLAVIGHPVAHSRSPAMQNAALAALGLEGEWAYEAIDVTPRDLAERLRRMPGEGFAGANVTVPHKQAALRLADEPSAAARQIGAANTLTFGEGEIRAHNTDADGFLNALPGSPRDRRVLVLGAGGAARAVVWALGREGAAVEIWNRSQERAERICAELGGAIVTDPDQGTYELIVNTSSAGLYGEDPFAHLPLAAERFDAAQTIVDMVYGERPSPLLAAAAAAGATIVDGLEILVQQGALSLRIWTAREAPIEAMRVAAGG